MNFRQHGPTDASAGRIQCICISVLCIFVSMHLCCDALVLYLVSARSSVVLALSQSAFCLLVYLFCVFCFLFFVRLLLLCFASDSLLFARSLCRAWLLLLLKWSSRRGWSRSWSCVRSYEARLVFQAPAPCCRPSSAWSSCIWCPLSGIRSVAYFSVPLRRNSSGNYGEQAPRAGLRKLLRSYLFIWYGHRLIHLPPGGTAGLAISRDIGQGLPTHYLSSGRPAEPIRFGHDLDAD